MKNYFSILKTEQRNRLSFCRFLLILFGFFFVLPALSVRANDSEFSPKSIRTNAQFLTLGKKQYPISNAYDGNLKTTAILLDTTRTGQRMNTTPPKGDLPITAELILDLGTHRSICGLRFFVPSGWKAVGVRNVSVYTCDDPDGKSNRRSLDENVELLPMNYNLSVVVVWKTIQTRYLVVSINNAWQIRDQRQGLAPENRFDVQIAEIRCLAAPPDDPIRPNDNSTPFPPDRLWRDWIYQDRGLTGPACFVSKETSETEQKMITNVLKELDDSTANSFRTKMTELVRGKIPAADPRWKELYRNACQERRKIRLADFFDEQLKIVYVKHHVFGGTEGLSTNMDVSDRNFRGLSPESRPGSQLCLLTCQKDGSIKHEVLIDKPNGLIRDPNLSWNAQTLIFAMRDSMDKDDFHLFTMDLNSRKVKQLTFTPEKNGRKFFCADIEPCFAPNGDIIFASSRCVQINDCWPQNSSMIFTCKPDGSNIRRLTYDELEVSYPQIMEDGRVLYTRWEYSDRNAYFMHPLFTMNPDGTMQTEYCGNNSMFPSSYLQARSVPGSNKIIAIISGHHVPNKGKLALVDRTRGTQDGLGIEFVAGSSPDGTPGRKFSWIKVDGLRNNPSVDYFGQKGPQFQNPFAIDEENFLSAYTPEGWAMQSGPYNPPFGIYWLDPEGRRELLAFDWRITSTQPVPVMARDIPPVKPSQIKPNEKYGTFLLQDVYYGPGLKGIPRGTVKKIRVVALEYRVEWAGTGANAGEIDAGYVQTPISINNGSWDVKHVLGEADIEADGSAAFKVPARVPVYFQLLDENGFCVQTMRSWSTLQPGETFACLGCHENKLETGEMLLQRPASLALKRGPQKLKPFAGKTHPLLTRLEKEKPFESIYGYVGINTPEGDPISLPNPNVDGFSYIKEIQPIWDRHCIACHSGTDQKTSANQLVKKAEPDLTGTIAPIDIKDPKILAPHYYKRVANEFYNGVRTPLYIDWMRNFTRSYLNLTNNGYVKGSKWVQWLECRSRPEMLPPYYTGSAKSSLMKYLEPQHYNVKLSKDEKRTVACWIDLLIPFCGDYWEANTWSQKDKEIYRYFLEKRIFFTEQELQSQQKNQ